jgi:hypothetical protein
MPNNTPHLADWAGSWLVAAAAVVLLLPTIMTALCQTRTHVSRLADWASSWFAAAAEAAVHYDGSVKPNKTAHRIARVLLLSHVIAC